MVVVALAVIHSQLTIFQLTKNGLHGLSGLSGLHANHRVWHERGISSDALRTAKTTKLVIPGLPGLCGLHANHCAINILFSARIFFFNQPEWSS